MSGFNRRLAACLVLVVGIAGCSSNKSSESGAPTPSDALQEVANMLRDYTSASGRPPAKASELAGFKNQYSVGYKAIESGDVVVIWGAKPADEGAVASGQGGTAVVAYEKTTPAEGGWVLLQNGTVTQMTAAEFAAAPKAK